MFRYVIVASLFFLSNVISSQTSNLELTLSSENVLDIKKQANGLLWAATDEGLNVFYDNEKYVFYSNIQDSLSILNSKIDKLFITSNDILISLSQDGLSVFNNEAFNFKQIKLESKPVFIVEDLFTSKFWIGTENSGYYVLNSNFELDGQYKFDPLSPLSISTSNLTGSKKESIIFKGDKVFIATKNGFNSFDKKLKTFKRFFRGKKTLFTTNNIIGINEINEKIVVVTEKEVVVFDPKENKFESRIKTFGDVKSLYKSSKNGLYLKTSKTNYVISDIAQSNYLKTVESLQFPDEDNVMIDNLNTTYFWSNDSNVITISDHNLEDIKKIELDGLINSIYSNNSQVLIGTNSGVKFMGSNNAAVNKIDDFISSNFFHVYKDKLINISGNKIQIKETKNKRIKNILAPIDLSQMSYSTNDSLIYFGYRDIHIFDISKEIFQKSIVSGSSFNDYQINNLKSIENKLFVSHDNGIFEILNNELGNSNSELNIIFYDYNELLNSSVPKGFIDIEKIGVNYYVTNQQSGLSLYENDFNYFIKSFTFNGDPTKSLASSTPTKLLYNHDEKTLFIGSTGSGLFKYNIENESFSNLNINDGMLSNNIYDFLKFDNKIFFQSGTGINYTENRLLKNITNEDGLNQVSYHDKSLHSIDNELLVSANEMIQIFSLESIESSNNNFNINTFNITGIDELNNKKIIPLKEKKIEIDYQTKTVLFDLFSDNSYKENQLQYFVEKIDSDEIVKNGYNNQIQLSGLPYYTSNLSFYAVNGNGVRSENSIKISVYNAPPWWLRVETIVGYFIFLIGFVSFFVKYRERKTKEKMEGERKSAELEEAKELQNSLLPKVLPSIEGFDISTYLKPATEIGGDYYDFFYKKGEYFYAICGDATGHGVISGIMVSVTKAGLHGVPMGDPSKILGQLNRIVKRVNFGRLRMSLSVAKFNKSAVELSSAAMPPTYFFSSKSKKVEEVLVPNLPLGGIETEKYDGVKKDFNSGDVMVMISDGLPELPNPANDLLDYEKVQECIMDNAEKSADEIKEALVYLSDEWANGVMNPDDITIVVIKKAA